MLQGCLKHVHEDGNAVYEMLQEIKGDMIIGGVKFNKTTHSLFVQVYLLMAQVEVGSPHNKSLAVRAAAKVAATSIVRQACIADSRH